MRKRNPEVAAEFGVSESRAQALANRARLDRELHPDVPPTGCLLCGRTDGTHEDLWPSLRVPRIRRAVSPCDLGHGVWLNGETRSKGLVRDA